jgi:ABC-type bacteriocin/lantibiotic exporter with double-glycine peptidase domain
MVRFVSWQRVQETLRMPAETRSATRTVVPSVRGDVRCEGVTFGYRPDKPVLRDVGFHVPAGRYVGIAGPSGSGKTTLLMLLCKLVRPWQGHILIDGRPLEALDWHALRPFVGVAVQESFVLNQSIAENMRLGCADATEEAMWRALDIADLGDTVRAMDGGLDAVVGESGSSLSEGQRQRLNIARAVIGMPRILILDEVTSSIGFDSERRIFARLRAALRDSTIFFASHRLSSFRDADRILVLRDGELIAQGPHGEIVETCDFYRTMFEEQSGRETA